MILSLLNSYATTTYTVKSRDSLFSISKKHYGHRAYHRTLSLDPDVPKAKDLKPGDSFQIKPLVEIILEAGFPVELKGSLEDIIWVQEKYHNNKAKKRVDFVKFRKRLEIALTKIRATKIKPFPKHMIRKLEETISTLQFLADGYEESKKREQPSYLHYYKEELTLPKSLSRVLRNAGRWGKELKK